MTALDNILSAFGQLNKALIDTASGIYTQRIDEDGYRHYLNALKEIARYSETVWEFGRQLHAAVCSKRYSGTLL